MAEPATTTLVLVAAGLAAGGMVGAWLSRAMRRPLATTSDAHREARQIRAEAETGRQVTLREAEIAAREAAISARGEAEVASLAREVALASDQARLASREVALLVEAQSLVDMRERLVAREMPVLAAEQDLAAGRTATRAIEAQALAMLEKTAALTAEACRKLLSDAEIEEARAQAAHVVRQVTESVADPEHVRSAKRIMGISVGRFSGHYLTERQFSTVPIGEARNGRAIIDEGTLRAIESVAKIKLTLAESQDLVRIEGLDGVGREVARRCLARMQRRSLRGGDAAVTRMAREIAIEVDREINHLGRRAFDDLEIALAHPDIVKLVGRLNFRTSYTQNQWKHAVEAAFLCGMMADELGLDRKIARRAALMHDIGKSLTHELDGSHAVIGADYARRLGETETVANAIGAHHTDEPFGSAYAYLVAAADAMSGARPGARRQNEDNHMAKLADLERISRNFPGVEEAFAVQGGREVRIYVHQDRVDDRGAIQLSSDVAARISEEMTFPGQIRITVIREFKAIETAT